MHPLDNLNSKNKKMFTESIMSKPIWPLSHLTKPRNQHDNEVLKKQVLGCCISRRDCVQISSKSKTKNVEEPV